MRQPVRLATLVFALIEGRNYGWWLTNADSRLLGRTWTAGGISPVALAMGVAVVSLAGLLRYESHRLSRGQSVLLDVTLFRIRTFGLGSFAGLIVSLGEFGLLFSLPLFLQSVLGWSALGAGGLLATLTAWCEHHNIPYQGVPVGTIKKHATGKGNAGKTEVMDAMRALGHPVSDDNEADALALLHWALDTQEG